MTATDTAKPPASPSNPSGRRGYVAACEECGETRMGCPRPWHDHRGEHRPHTCYQCHDLLDEAEAEREAERTRLEEAEAALTEEDRMWDAREMAGEW